MTTSERQSRLTNVMGTDEGEVDFVISSDEETTSLQLTTWFPRELAERSRRLHPDYLRGYCDIRHYTSGNALVALGEMITALGRHYQEQHTQREARQEGVPRRVFTTEQIREMGGAIIRPEPDFVTDGPSPIINPLRPPTIDDDPRPPVMSDNVEWRAHLDTYLPIFAQVLTETVGGSRSQITEVMVRRLRWTLMDGGPAAVDIFVLSGNLSVSQLECHISYVRTDEQEPPQTTFVVEVSEHGARHYYSADAVRWTERDRQRQQETESPDRVIQAWRETLISELDDIREMHNVSRGTVEFNRRMISEGWEPVESYRNVWEAECSRVDDAEQTIYGTIRYGREQGNDSQEWFRIWRVRPDVWIEVPTERLSDPAPVRIRDVVERAPFQRAPASDIRANALQTYIDLFADVLNHTQTTDLSRAERRDVMINTLGWQLLQDEGGPYLDIFELVHNGVCLQYTYNYESREDNAPVFSVELEVGAWAMFGETEVEEALERNLSTAEEAQRVEAQSRQDTAGLVEMFTGERPTWDEALAEFGVEEAPEDQGMEEITEALERSGVRQRRVVVWDDDGNASHELPSEEGELTDEEIAAQDAADDIEAARFRDIDDAMIRAINRNNGEVVAEPHSEALVRLRAMLARERAGELDFSSFVVADGRGDDPVMGVVRPQHGNPGFVRWRDILTGDVINTAFHGLGDHSQVVTAVRQRHTRRRSMVLRTEHAGGVGSVSQDMRPLHEHNPMFFPELMQAYESLSVVGATQIRQFITRTLRQLQELHRTEHRDMPFERAVEAFLLQRMDWLSADDAQDLRVCYPRQRRNEETAARFVQWVVPSSRVNGHFRVQRSAVDVYARLRPMRGAFAPERNERALMIDG